MLIKTITNLKPAKKKQAAIKKAPKLKKPLIKSPKPTVTTPRTPEVSNNLLEYFVVGFIVARVAAGMVIEIYVPSNGLDYLWPEHCSECAKELHNITNPLWYLLSDTPCLSTKPKHYHVWDLGLSPPKDFTSYGLDRPLVMKNPYGTCREDVWEDPHNNITPETLTNPTVFNLQRKNKVLEIIYARQQDLEARCKSNK